MYFLRYCFNFACFSAAFAMTIFWCYNFWKDDDLSLVHYKKFEGSSEVAHPMISFCLLNPVMESKLKSYNDTFASNDYIDFLLGIKDVKGMEKLVRKVLLKDSYQFLQDLVEKAA